MNRKMNGWIHEWMDCKINGNDGLQNKWEWLGTKVEGNMGMDEWSN